jgi:hypothetical protein
MVASKTNGEPGNRHPVPAEAQPGAGALSFAEAKLVSEALEAGLGRLRLSTPVAGAR